MVLKSISIENCPPHMIVQDHMVIEFGKIVHPTCLYGTTRQLRPLEYFTTVDVKKGYWQLELDKES